MSYLLMQLHSLPSNTTYQSIFISNITENTYCLLVVSQGDSNASETLPFC